MKDETHHAPVLLEEVLAIFRERIRSEKPQFFDGTLGGAGHSEAILRNFPEAELVSFDQDAVATERAERRLADFGGRVKIVQENFRNLSVWSGKQQARPFDGLLLDLGISSDQLDDRERGFSYFGASTLDMRMDRSQGLTALELLNTYSHGKLARVFEFGGQRRNARKLADAICEARPLSTSQEFVSICDQVLGTARERRLKKERGGSSGAHSATVPFQAIRIAVNDELGAVNEFLEEAPKVAADGAVLAVITFHSLEDELVTQRFRKWSRPTGATRNLPGLPALGRHLTQKPIVPSDREAEQNSRVRSARLRVFQFQGTGLFL